MILIYAVFRESVYRHECVGLFSSVPLAEAAIVALLPNEDGRHSFLVYPFTLDERTPATPCDLWGNDEPYGHDFGEPEPVLEYRGNKYPKNGEPRYTRIATEAA